MESHWGEFSDSRKIESIPAELKNELIKEARKPNPANIHRPCIQEEETFVKMEVTSSHWGELSDSRKIESIPAKLKNELINEARKPNPANTYHPCIQEEETFVKMEVTSSHWGEFSDSRKIESIPAELKNELINEALNNANIRHPCIQEEETYVKISPECSAMDKTVLHAIQLSKHCKTLQGLISSAQQAEQTNDIDFGGPILLQPAVPIPEQPERIESHAFKYPFRYLEKEFNSFSRGKGQLLPKFSEDVVKKVLQKSVATILAHIGYDTTTNYILDTLTDIAEEYILKLTNRLRIAVDQEALMGNTGFPDVIERVFHEMGIGSVLTLHEFYQTRILKYREKVMRECTSLQEEYASHFLPVLQPANETEIVRYDTNENDNEEDIPEIHFPALGEGYSADELQPSLEPGFQMLHSLEQEEQLQNLEPEEEIKVSDSPTNTHISLTKYLNEKESKSKKKRKKVSFEAKE